MIDDRMRNRAVSVVREQIRDAYLSAGSASAVVDELLIPLESWRAAARAVGRQLGRPVQTVVAGDRVHAVLRDWPRDNRERQIHDTALRAAAQAAVLNPNGPHG